MHVYDYVVAVGYEIVTRSIDEMLHDLDCACYVWIKPWYGWKGIFTTTQETIGISLL